MPTLQSILQNIQTDIMKPVLVLVLSWGLILFLWGLTRYLKGGVKDKKEAASSMLWGVVILAVMFSVWGLVAVVRGFFFSGAEPNRLPPIPYFNQSGGGSSHDIPTTNNRFIDLINY